MLTATRRELILGAAALAGCAPSAVSAAPLEPWVGYDKRLQAGLVRTREALRTDISDALLGENNAFRQTQNLRPLLDHPELALAAQAHLADMHDRNFFGHVTPDNFSPSARAGLICRTILGAYGENIAFIENARQPPTARQFFEGWRDSPAHRENMLRAAWTHVGHAALRFGARTYAAAVFATLSSRLQAPLPLYAGGADLHNAMRSADPDIRSYLVSEPDGERTGATHVVAGPSPRLSNGALRLRPLLQRDAVNFEVLWGPIFFVG